MNRRQTEPWERDALAELRDGHVALAVAAYRAHDRVVVTGDRAGMIDAGVDRWLAAHRAGQVPVLLAGTNETVDALSAAVRRALLDQRVLGDPVEGSAGSLAVGERLMIRVNDYRATGVDRHRMAVLNGQTGTLTGTCEEGIVVRMDHDGAEVVLSSEAVGAGAVGYAYASTAHRAQGGTWDLAITVGLEGLYREASYLVLSRGRASNWLVVTAPELEMIDADLARHDSPIPLTVEAPGAIDQELIEVLASSRRKLLALTRDPHVQAIGHAAEDLDLTELEARADHARRVEQQAERVVGADPERLRDRLVRTTHTGGHIAIGTLVKAWDRRNIGTVTRLDDPTGTVDVEFTSARGATATRTLGWGDVQIVLPRTPPPRPMSDVATATLDRLASALVAQVDAWEQHLADHGVKPGDQHIYEHAAQLAIDRATASLTHTRPGGLAALLGQRPSSPPAAVQVWDDAVRDLATHRARHKITDPAVPTGPEITDPAGAAVWNGISEPVAQARVWLDTHTTRPAIAVTRTRSITELDLRRRELEGIFATAPADHRTLIEAMQSGGLLPLDDTADLLRDALAAYGDRRRWILEHWPHVVEYTQINDTIDRGLAGPDVTPILGTLAVSAYPRLAAAAAASEPWLVTLAAQLVPPDDLRAGPAAERLFADVASYRHRWAITGPAPLGDGALDSDQAAERTVLSLAVNHAAEATRDMGRDDRQPPRHVQEALFGLDDTWG